MILCNPKILADDAVKKGYAVPALNTNGVTYDITRAIIEAAEELRAPLIIQSYEPNLEYRGFDVFPYLVKHLSEGCTIPIAIHLDHGQSIHSVLKAVKAGFTGVMIDYAALPLEDNMAGTQRVIDLVKPLGISVEAEVGHIIKSSDQEGKKSPTTSMVDVKTFMSKVNVDLLAVAVGTTHGIFKLQTGIDQDLIKEIRHAVEVPLVLHGTCGVPLEDITACMNSGMSKINFGEMFRMNYIKYFNEYSRTLKHEHHVWKIAQACKDRVKSEIKDIIKAMDADGKADGIRI